jgi:hypothetical protein
VFRNLCPRCKSPKYFSQLMLSSQGQKLCLEICVHISNRKTLSRNLCAYFKQRNFVQKFMCIFQTSNKETLSRNLCSYFKQKSFVQKFVFIFQTKKLCIESESWYANLISTRYPLLLSNCVAKHRGEFSFI